jgi:serine/threonine-protein kinase
MEDELAERCRSRVGTVLNGKWRLDRLLGVGGMAAVYLATHRNGKEAAVKVLHAEISRSADIRERFLREGYAANRVKSGGAVSVFDDDVAEDGSAYLVMEYLEGETLEARRERKGGRLPADEVLAIVDQVLGTLAAAHAQGIVHRDLKPENLFLTHSGAVKILDFGIARLVEPSKQKSATQTGSLMGTPAFMPPEQARGRWSEVDGRTDLWAIGATMFMLLSGRYVHEAETVNEAIAMAVTQPARSLASVAPEVPGSVGRLVDRALAYEKEQRWADAGAMQESVRHAYHHLSDPDDEPQAEGRLIPRAVEQTLPVPPTWIGDLPATSPAMTTSGIAASARARTAPPDKRTVAVAAAVGALLLAAGLIALNRSSVTPENDQTNVAQVSAISLPAASVAAPAPAEPTAATPAVPVVDIAALPTSKDEPTVRKDDVRPRVAIKTVTPAASPPVVTTQAPSPLPPRAALPPTAPATPEAKEKSRESILLRRR